MSQGAYPSFDPVTGRPLPPAPAAYSEVDPYAPASYAALDPSAMDPYAQNFGQPLAYPPDSYQQPPAGYQQPPAGYQQPLAGYQHPAGYLQPLAGYQQPPAGYPGYAPPVGYQLVPMYPMVVQRPPKPGGAVAAAVLGYVQSGFVLVGGILLFSGTAGFEALGTRIGSELTVVAIFAIVAGALLIAGATTMLNRKPSLLTIGCLTSIAISVYFVVRLADFLLGVAVWVPIVYAVLPILSIALSMTSDVRAWVRARASLSE